MWVPVVVALVAVNVWLLRTRSATVTGWLAGVNVCAVGVVAFVLARNFATLAPGTTDQWELTGIGCVFLLVALSSFLLAAPIGVVAKVSATKKTTAS